jgi:hypothetical protein
VSTHSPPELGFERFERLYTLIPTTAKSGEGLDVLLDWLTAYALAPSETTSAQDVREAVAARLAKKPHSAPPVPPASGKGPFAEYARKLI